jgi:hypothetical protein
MPGRGCLGNALDAVALLVGAIGVANIMIISVLVAARRSAPRPGTRCPRHHDRGRRDDLNDPAVAGEHACGGAPLQGHVPPAALTSTHDNTALHADLSEQPSAAPPASYIAEQLTVVDNLIDRFSPYGDDIRRNGIRRGGVLFPVVIDLPGEQRIGGFDSTDCYSRTLFAQHHSGITVSGVLESCCVCRTPADRAACSRNRRVTR